MKRFNTGASGCKKRKKKPGIHLTLWLVLVFFSWCAFVDVFPSSVGSNPWVCSLDALGGLEFWLHVTGS